MFFISKFIPALLMPINLCFYAVAFGIYRLWRGKKRTAVVSFILGITILYIAANPFIGYWYIRKHEIRTRPVASSERASAVLVLGGFLPSMERK